jgi:hypothetical protein
LDDAGIDRIARQGVSIFRMRCAFLAAFLLLFTAFALAQRPLSIENAPDLQQWAQELAKEPVSALSARRLARIYEYCGLFAGPKSRDEWMALFLPTVKTDTLFGKKRTELAQLGYSRCAKIVANGADVFGMREKWIKHAANQGDLVAKLILRQHQTPTAADIVAFETELKLALNSADPEVIWEAARSLAIAGFDWQSISSKTWPGKKVDALRAVFQLAACELGYPCGSDSALIKTFCIRGTCAPQSYAQWLPTFLSNEQNKLVQAEMPRVLSALKQRRGSSLIFQ